MQFECNWLHVHGAELKAIVDTSVMSVTFQKKSTGGEDISTSNIFLKKKNKQKKHWTFLRFVTLGSIDKKLFGRFKGVV